MLSPLFSQSSANEPPLTEDQARVLQRITDLARLHFARATRGCVIQPRLWPLIVGPTGCGKSHLCRLLTQSVDAHYLRLSYGDWIVQGARSFCTLFRVLAAAVDHPHVVVHLDELDKLPVTSEQEWSRAVANEIWSLIDHELPLERFVTDPDVRSRHKDEALQTLQDHGVGARLFIVGSGTWQEIFDARLLKGQIGFGQGAVEARVTDHRAALREVIATRGPMAELLARFDGAVQLIRPPSLPEALVLLERAGARAYAEHVHYDEVRVLVELLPRQGFRALQSVVTELMLRGWQPGSPPRDVGPGPVRLVRKGQQREFRF